MSVIDEYLTLAYSWLSERVKDLPILTGECSCGETTFVMVEQYERTSTVVFDGGAARGTTDGFEDFRPTMDISFFVCAECGSEYRSDEVSPDSVDWN